MKKYLALVLGVLFVLGFAASAFAIHAEIPSETQAVIAKGTTQITLGGEIRVRGEIRKNVSDFNDNTRGANDGGYYDQRVRLSIEAKVTPNTTGFVQVESGNVDNLDNWTWGGTGTGVASGTTGAQQGFAYDARGGYTVGSGKRGDLRILQAWIQHQGSGLLGIPAGFKIGHMPIAVGNGLFFRHTYEGDDAIVLFTTPTKGLEVSLADVKLREGNVQNNDDSDAYSLQLNYKPSKTTGVGFDVSYLNDQNQGASLADVHLWNIGARFNTQIAGFGIFADAAMQTGKQVDRGAGNADIKYRGYAAWAGVSYKLNPVKLSLEYAYGSGDDNSTDNKVKGFVTTQGHEQHFTYVYEYRTVNAAGQANGGLVNTQFVKLGANADVTKKINLNLAGYWLRAVKKNMSIDGTGTARDSKSIGTEIDARIVYKIDRNFVYFVEGGYLFAGNFWRAAGSTTNVDDAYAVRHGITLSF